MYVAPRLRAAKPLDLRLQLADLGLQLAPRGLPHSSRSAGWGCAHGRRRARCFLDETDCVAVHDGCRIKAALIARRGACERGVKRRVREVRSLLHNVAAVQPEAPLHQFMWLI